MGTCPGWWGEGGVETMRQEPEPSHTALSTKSLMLILLTQHRLTVFILYTFSALLPWLQVFWPISPSCSCSHHCVCHPPSCPTPPLLWLSVILSPDHFLQQKKKSKSLSPFFLPTDSFCLLLFLTQSRNTPRLQGSVIPWGALCTRHPSRNLRSAPPNPLSPPVWVCFREVRLKFTEL